MNLPPQRNKYCFFCTKIVEKDSYVAGSNFHCNTESITFESEIIY